MFSPHSDDLDAQVRAWRDVSPPDGLGERIAARTLSHEKGLTPGARPIVRRLRWRPVAALSIAAVLLATVLLWPGSPGHPQIAYADVERAMLQVQTVHCFGRMETTRTTAQGASTNTQSMEYWAVLGQHVQDARAAQRTSTPGTWPGRNHAGWETSPLSGAALHRAFMRLLFPPSSGADDVLAFKTGQPQFMPWQRDTVRQGNQNLLRFQHREADPRSDHIQTVLIDPQTRLVVDVTDRRHYQMEAKVRPNSPATVTTDVVELYRTSGFEYDRAVPAEVFAADAPARH